ncbi:hypothetical protein ANO11243_034100 [Dothideomycetidae sp. 11243]|nr:hypothetical protein ANO11243_034100 [fungal sp. No.11243]
MDFPAASMSTMYHIPTIDDSAPAGTEGCWANQAPRYNLSTTLCDEQAAGLVSQLPDHVCTRGPSFAVEAQYANQTAAPSPASTQITDDLLTPVDDKLPPLGPLLPLTFCFPNPQLQFGSCNMVNNQSSFQSIFCSGEEWCDTGVQQDMAWHHLPMETSEGHIGFGMASLPQALPSSFVPAEDHGGYSSNGHVVAHDSFMEMQPQNEQHSSFQPSTFALPPTPRRGPPREAEASDEAYAHLLFKCLDSVPEKQMSLKQIYEWMRANCSRVRDGRSSGWQNSVRHNLSMNQAFEKVPSSSGSGISKKVTHWRLSAEAIEQGYVRSTTFYRRTPSTIARGRRAARTTSPTSIPPLLSTRAAAGAKGGQASRRAAERRQVIAARRVPTSAPTMQYQYQQNQPQEQQRFPSCTRSEPDPSAVLSPAPPLTVGSNTPADESPLSMDAMALDANWASTYYAMAPASGVDVFVPVVQEAGGWMLPQQPQGFWETAALDGGAGVGAGAGSIGMGVGLRRLREGRGC